MTETLKLFFNLRPWQTLTTQKLSEKLYLSVPTMLKVLKMNGSTGLLTNRSIKF